MQIVYDVIVKYLYFHKRVGRLISYHKPPKLQEMLFDYIFKLCKNCITFL